MSGKERGLGNFDWLSDRAQAEASMYQGSGGAAEPPDQPADQPADQPEPEPKSLASKSASNSANVSASRRASKRASKKGGKGEVLAPATDEAPPPPPARSREPMVQFNHRIFTDRDQILQEYKAKHGTTMQAIVNQMVDEYLDRRGLLPKDADE